MTATSLDPTALPTVTQKRVIISEWLKLRSLRSTMFSLLAAVVCTVGLGILISALRANDIKSHGGFLPGPSFDPAAVTLRGVYLAQLAIGVLGVLVVTGEYSTGMIRATVAAVPHRLPVLWAKALVFAVVVFVTMAVSSLVAFEAGARFFAGAGIHIGLGSPGAARAVLGAALYLTVISLLGVGLGFLIRNTAGAIAALFGLMLVLPPLVSALPPSLYADGYRFLPLTAGSQITTTVRDPSLLAPWSGIGVFALYAVAAAAGGAVVLKRRDA
ncbi:MAG: type transport system permease protein [Acidimicrobiaceae bacterium]|nr:type transport system permease protein [Acidimicrobiaceae bacterium]